MGIKGIKPSQNTLEKRKQTRLSHVFSATCLCGCGRENNEERKLLASERAKELLVAQEPISYMSRKIRSGHRTSAERKVEELLKKYEINYIFERRVGRYWADFLLPEYFTIIEVDGDFYHRNAADRDKIKDEYLSKRGWFVIRIRESEFDNKIQLVEQKIATFGNVVR